MEGLRGTFAAKTDGYKVIIEENDIDGKVRPANYPSNRTCLVSTRL